MWIGPEDHKLVGAYLADLRKCASMSQVELARRLGKPQSFVSAYERGQRRVDFLEFAHIAAALGVDGRAAGVELVKVVVAHEEQRGRSGRGD